MPVPSAIVLVLGMGALDYVAQRAGSNLDVQVLDYTPATTGEIFQVDTISIRIVP
jgi:hypothetical protein